ncbi:MAG: biotin/lipoyl-containing protein [Enhygromyxa sp.]
MTDSRQFVPELTADLDRLADGRTILRAPSPGLWGERPTLGSLLRSGDELGWIEILGVAHRLRAPEGAVGIVVDEGPQGELARRPVNYGAPLLTLDPEALGGALAVDAAAASGPRASDGSLQFRAPSSGRFYARPAPDKPAFVEVGQVIERGQTLGLLEVMKTFTRINYDDPKLPARAKILAIVAADQADLDHGDVILQVEAREPPAEG